MNNRIYVGLMCVALFLCSVWAGYTFVPRKAEPPAPIAAVVAQEDPFKSLELQAHAVFVWDVPEEKVLFASHEEVQLPLASLTKVMTALLAAEELLPDTLVKINGDAIRQEGDSGFLAGELWRLQNLIDLTLVTSSNDGAFALASAVSALPPRDTTVVPVSFSERMNAKAQEIGMRQTFFINPSGLDVHEGVSGSYGSAKDFALLLEYVIRNHPTLLEATERASITTSSESGKKHTGKNTNEFVESIPGILASKTGTTDLAGGNLAIVFEIAPLHPVIAVVLGSTADGRFDDVKRIVDAVVESYRINLLVSP